MWVMAAQEKEKEHAADKCNTWQACNKSILDEKYHSSQMQHLCPWWKIKIISHTFRNPFTWPLDHHNTIMSRITTTWLIVISSCLVFFYQLNAEVVGDQTDCNWQDSPLWKIFTTQTTGKYRKKSSTKHRQVQKIGKYIKQVSTENRQVQNTGKYRK